MRGLRAEEQKMGWKRRCCWGGGGGGDLLCRLTLVLGFLLPACRTRLYTNHWAVRIAGGLPEANRIASKYGYVNIGQVTLLTTTSERAGAGSGAGCGELRRGGRRGTEDWSPCLAALSPVELSFPSRCRPAFLRRLRVKETMATTGLRCSG